MQVCMDSIYVILFDGQKLALMGLGLGQGPMRQI